MITMSQIAQKIVTFTAATTTSGTRFNVAHGLGYPPATQACRVQATADATDNDNACGFAVVSCDSTNVVLKPDRTLGVPTTGRLYIALEENGPVNSGRP